MRAFLALVALLVMAGFSFSVNVASCQVINSPGVYTLTQSIIGGSPQPYGASFDDTCIGINTSNVVLDCAGFTIDPGASSMGTAVAQTSGSTLDRSILPRGIVW